ncbi:MAG: hypothetical protein OXR73_32090 [Myxococcales bacterium]|nr:hypothetical protein [Myxococcales bacterium]
MVPRASGNPPGGGIASVAEVLVAAPVTVEGEPIISHRFRLEGIGPGFDQAVMQVHVAPLVVPLHVHGVSSDGFQRFRPGAARSLAVTIVATRSEPVQSSPAYQWWEDFAGGAGLARPIVLDALNHEGDLVAPHYRFEDCVPLSWSFRTSGSEREPVRVMETLSISCGRWTQFDDAWGSELGAWLLQTINQAPEEALPRDLSIQYGDQSVGGTAIDYLESWPTRYIFPEFDKLDPAPITHSLGFRPTRIRLD